MIFKESFKVTDAQHDLFAQAASKKGISLQEWLNETCIAQAEKELKSS